MKLVREGSLMESAVVRCAEGHVFHTTSLPMQNVGAARRLGPGGLVRCPRCGRLRNVVPVGRESR